MRRLALVLTLLPLVAYGDIILKDESTRVGPVTTINCTGADVTCTRSGATANITVGPSGAAAAPKDADYLVKTANATLSAERVVTNTSTVVWDWSITGQARASVVQLPADGTNCAAGEYNSGVDEFGNAQDCAADQGIGNLRRTTSDFVTGSLTYTDVTGLKWPVDGMASYSSFHCYLRYSSSVTSTGLMFAVNGPVGSTVDYRLEIQTAGNPGAGAMSTTTQPWTHGTSLDEATTPTSGVAVINTPYYATLVGVIKTGADDEKGGEVAIRVLSETEDPITVKAGSWCVYY